MEGTLNRGGASRPPKCQSQPRCPLVLKVLGGSAQSELQLAQDTPAHPRQVELDARVGAPEGVPPATRVVGPGLRRERPGVDGALEVRPLRDDGGVPEHGEVPPVHLVGEVQRLLVVVVVSLPGRLPRASYSLKRL